MPDLFQSLLEPRVFLKQIRSTPISNNATKLFVPYRTFGTGGELLEIKTFGIDTPGDIFSKCLSLKVTPNSNAAYFQAITTGHLKYDSSGTTDRLILTIANPIFVLKIQAFLPNWFPLPKYIIYENVNDSETTTIITDYLASNPKIKNQLNRLQGISASEADLATMFVSGTLQSIPVPAGATIGKAALIDGVNPGFNIYMQDQLDNPDDLYLDPGIYFQHLASHFADLVGRTEEDNLKSIFAGPKSNCVVRYVASTSSTTSGDFLTPASASQTIGAAIAVANDFDTIVIVDTATYKESEIDLNKGVHLCSLANTDVFTTTSLPSFPTLSGDNTQRVIKVEASSGIAGLSNLIIAEGNLNDLLSRGGGGGIQVLRSDEVYIRNCVIQNNQNNTFSNQLTEHGFGGGIHCHYASPFIYNNRIKNNKSNGRGGGISVFGYGWPVIMQNFIEGNTALGGQPDGGGIAVEIAYPSDFSILYSLYGLSIDENVLIINWNPNELRSAFVREVKILGNKIIRNTADDDGGGIYASVFSKLYVYRNEIEDNKAGEGGGGIRVTMSSTTEIVESIIQNNMANYKKLKVNKGGGGVSSRNGNIILENVVLQNNTAEGWAGGGVHLITVDPGLPWSPIINHVFFQKETRLLIRDSATEIKENHCTLFTNQTTDRRKGAGIYALRQQFMPLTVGIKDVTKVSDNVLDTFLGHPSITGITFPDSENFHLEDRDPAVFIIDDPTIIGLSTNNEFSRIL